MINIEEKDKVSVIIVCMNNIGNLFPCLNSIKQYTNCNYEVLVVAYLFNNENLLKLKQEYNWIKVIESNEIRGFAENNNLALKKATGNYCFVLNDDTILDYDVISGLLISLKKTPEATVMSPKTLNADGTTQSCGRPPMNLTIFMLQLLHLWKEQKVKSRYTYQDGIFQSYNIVGAAFLIRKDIFSEIGFFDEKYFFCPEDIALSTQLNKLGYKCFVDSNLYLYHLEGGSSSKIVFATMPSRIKGELIFYTDNNLLKKIVLYPYVAIVICVKLLAMYMLLLSGKKSNASNMCKAYINTIKSMFLSHTTKEIFIRYYQSQHK